MRIAVVSDIHANLAALDAVLRHAAQVDAVWCTGDTVGYGPQPSECIARLRGLGAVWVAGNHERAATGALSTAAFNPAAAEAAEWTRRRLTDAEKAALDALPEVCQANGCILAHGTVRDPIWEYMFDAWTARAHLDLVATRVSFVGHTHVPAVAREERSAPEGCTLSRLLPGDVVDLAGDAKVVLNAGSVGQPRDHDPRASYGVLDTAVQTFTLHRVEYDIAATQKLMAEEGLPLWLIQRLSSGR